MEYLTGKAFLGDFARRTLANLEIVEAEAATSKNAYEVTQLINSLLGLIVFPWERLVRVEDNDVPFKTLSRYIVHQANSKNDKYYLMKNLRHAMSHSHVLFVKDNYQDEFGKAKIKEVIFVSCEFKNGKPQCSSNTECEKCLEKKKRKNEFPDFQLTIPVKDLRNCIKALVKELETRTLATNNLDN